MEDAQPKVEATIKAANRVIASEAVQTCGRIGYKGLVNTLGVGLGITNRIASALKRAIEKNADNK
jgi:hypothetical protein